MKVLRLINSGLSAAYETISCDSSKIELVTFNSFIKLFRTVPFRSCSVITRANVWNLPKFSESSNPGGKITAAPLFGSGGNLDSLKTSISEIIEKAILSSKLFGWPSAPSWLNNLFINELEQTLTVLFEAANLIAHQRVCFKSDLNMIKNNLDGTDCTVQ